MGRVMLMIGIAAGLAACSSAGPATPDSRALREASTTDRGTQSSLLQLVVNKILLPVNVEEYSLDLDGDGTRDNQLGAIQGALATLPLGYYDFQSNIDRVLGEGGFLLLMDLLGRSLADDPGVRLEAAMGIDLDSPINPGDNFSGTETLAVSSTSPKGLVLEGAIQGGKLAAGPGTLIAPLPSPAGSSPETVTIQRAQVTAEVSASGFGKGRLNGGIPWAEVDQKFLPMVARELTAILQDSKTTENVRNALTVAFDGNKDGKVTADELRQSQILKLVLKADVDLDNDKTPDALSVGMAFTAVPCIIKR